MLDHKLPALGYIQKKKKNLLGHKSYLRWDTHTKMLDRYSVLGHPLQLTCAQPQKTAQRHKYQCSATNTTHTTNNGGHSEYIIIAGPAQ